MPAVTRAAVALGSNIGHRAGHLADAVTAIAALEGTTVVAVSDVYETDPAGGPQQGAYLNAVVIIDTGLVPTALLAACHAIEQHAGRQRVQHWGPRTLDLDVLVHGDTVSTGAIDLPHPRAHERAFVLVPWAQVASDMYVPGHGRVGDLAHSVGNDGVRWAGAADLITTGVLA